MVICGGGGDGVGEVGEGGGDEEKMRARRWAIVVLPEEEGPERATRRGGWCRWGEDIFLKKGGEVGGGGRLVVNALSVAFVSSHTCLLDPFQILQTCLRSLLGVFCR